MADIQRRFGPWDNLCVQSIVRGGGAVWMLLALVWSRS